MSRLVVAWIGLLGAAACSDGRLQPFVINEPGGELAETPASPPPGGSEVPVASEPAAPGPGPETQAIQQPLLVDDLEDGDFQVRSPLTGVWYAFNDLTSMQAFDVVPLEVPNLVRDGSAYAVRTAGRRFVTWGAGVGVSLFLEPVHGQMRAMPLDVGAFDALSFWARASQNSDQLVYVHMLNPDRDGDDEEEHFTTTFSLTTSWQRYVLPFSDFVLSRDQGPVPGEAFDTANLLHVQFFWFFPRNFEAWVDDLAFMPPSP